MTAKPFGNFPIDRYARDGIAHSLPLPGRTTSALTSISCFSVPGPGRMAAAYPGETPCRTAFLGPAGNMAAQYVVQPVRSARRAMKDWQRHQPADDVEPLRQRVKDIELACERQAQHVLIETAGD